MALVSLMHPTQNGQTDIYAIDVQNPAQIVRLTQHASVDYEPAWSPDGRWVAFVTGRNDNYDIYLASADGSGTFPLLLTDAHELFPIWSLDGSQIMVNYMQGDFAPLGIMIIPVMEVK
jgi:TolB protein